jgi:HD-GYP domain-containing protein (c-di-GMP phosphodiesterase class II)
MRTIDVSELKPGMVFSSPVYIEADNLLVPAGVAIRQKDIDHLSTWGYTSVSTDGDMVTPPEELPGANSVQSGDGAEAARGNALSLTDVQENKSAYRSYLGLIEKLDTVFAGIGSGISLENKAVDNLAQKLLQAIRDERAHIIGFILGGEVIGRDFAKSSVNSAILSALIAIELKFSHFKVMQVVIAALLHDVGMLRLPHEITKKSGGLSADELKRMKTHPIHSYKIITKELLFPDEIGIVALQHHERWDGEGYPKRIAGDVIDAGARVISVADAFEAMVSEKPYRNSMIGYKAIKNLLADNSRRFDPNTLRAFVKTMGIYPIASVVMLNNGAVGRVTEVQGDAPLRPKIRILIDQTGKLFRHDEGDLIDLLGEKSLFITRALNPKDISLPDDEETG